MVIFAATEVSGAVASWHLLPRNSRSITLPGFGVALTFHISYFKDFDQVLFYILNVYVTSFNFIKEEINNLKWKPNKSIFLFDSLPADGGRAEDRSITHTGILRCQPRTQNSNVTNQFSSFKKLNLDQLLSCQGSPQPRKKENI